MIESTIPAEPRGNTVAAPLRICCRPQNSPARRQELNHVIGETLGLVTHSEPTTAVFRTRVGLTALDLAGRSASRPQRSSKAARADEEDYVAAAVSNTASSQAEPFGRRMAGQDIRRREPGGR